MTGQRSHALTTRAAACEEEGTGRGTPIVTHGGVFDGDVAVRTANTRANGHGVAVEVTHTIDRVQGQAISFKPGQSEAAGGTFVTEEFAPTVQAQNNGSTAVPAVAFKPSHFTRGKDGKPSEVTPPLSADADKGDQDTVVATPIDLRQASRGEKVTNNRSSGSGGPPGHGVGDSGDPAFTVSERGQAVAIYLQDVAIGGNIAGTLDTTRPSRGGCQAVAFTKAKLAQSNQDDESWIPGDVAPTQNQFDQGATRATTVVAFRTNQTSAKGPIHSEHTTDTLAQDHPPAVVAFANRTRDGIKVPEVMKDGVVSALMNPGGGGRSDAVNVVAPGPVQVQWASGGGNVENPTMQSLRSNAEYNYQFIRNAMQVRRLTPTECAYLQGFPADYLDITFRKKPAADGPKYRALGNSMAVPCMWWLGKRIHEATQCD